MAMAFCAAQREAEPDLAERVGAVDVVADDVLFGVDAAFFVEARVAVEAGGDQLLLPNPTDCRPWAEGGSKSPASCSIVN